MSDPVVGSVTPKACKRNSPVAILGRYFCFCSSEPCRSTVPIVYIWAWQAEPWQPLSQTVSRITEPARSERPEPPYSSGISAAK